MNRRRIAAFALAIAAAATMRGELKGQDASPESRNRRTWVGTIDDRLVLQGLSDETPAHHPAKYFHDLHVSWVYVSEPNRQNPQRFHWVSRRISWRAIGTSSSLYTGRDCNTQGSVDLGPAPSGFALLPEEQAKLHLNCTNWDTPGTWTITRNLPPSVPVPEVDVTMTNCEPTRSWVTQGVYYTQSVFGGELSAQFALNPVEGWTPEPGRHYQVVAAASSPARWRFVVESSRLRGYATNADIDHDFFARHGLLRLESSYRSLSPDLMFDPDAVQQASNTWKPPSPPGGPQQWGTLESRQGATTALVDFGFLTAMDYGAHGELRGYVTPPCGGVWMEAAAVDSELPVSKLPTDKDDNFISDDERQYDRLAALSDEDDDPKGDGTRGDGFTAFEEYRGFIYPVEEGCGWSRMQHVRTDPKKKDLFLHTSDPVLWRVAETFGATSGLNVHMTCPENYGGDDVRVVNFTMHSISGPSALGEGLRGARLTQAEPQHGLHLVNEQLGGQRLGESLGLNGYLGIGPPRNIDRVAFDLPGIRAAYGAARAMQFLTVIVHHELGHAVGIQHHGDGNIKGPIVLMRMPGCIAGMTEGTVYGQPACQAEGIAVRQQQNSGNAFCPMKYLHWRWYVPVGPPLTRTDMVEFRPNTSWSWQQPVRLEAYDGRVQRYLKDRDTPPSPPDMKFCVNPTGTGINELPVELNHAGNSSRPPCASQLRVNDVGSGSSGTRR